jgi:hypothetical protein
METMKPIRRKATWTTLITLTSATVLLPVVAEARGGGGGEGQHLLSVGAGIASPSAVTGLFSENPAGLVYNSGFSFLGQASTYNDNFKPLNAGGGLFAGNGTVGGALSLNTTIANGATLSNSPLALNWGLAAEIASLKTSFGFRGSHIFTSNSAYAGSTFGLDAGIIIHPKDQSRFGITAYDVNDGIDYMGAGWAYDFNPQATFAIDGTYGFTGGGASLKPGMAVNLDAFHLSSGYGFNVANGGGARIYNGVSLGVGFNAGRSLVVQLYYNQLARYYAGLTITL